MFAFSFHMANANVATYYFAFRTTSHFSTHLYSFGVVRDMEGWENCERIEMQHTAALPESSSRKEQKLQFHCENWNSFRCAHDLYLEVLLSCKKLLIQVNKRCSFVKPWSKTSNGIS